MKKLKKIPMYDILQYEVHSNRFTPWISNKYLQNLIASYLAWKTARKYKRYAASLEIRNQILK